MHNLSDYLSLFPGSSREKPRFMALASAVLRQATDLGALVASLQPGFSFGQAAGKQLDDLAAAVGLKRTDTGIDASDEAFRQYLLAKLALWGWDGTNESATAVLGVALPGVREADNQDGTVTVSPAGTAKDLLPVPAGIAVIPAETQE